MNSRERVLRTITFKGADIIPVHTWVLPGAAKKYDSLLQELRKDCPEDFAGDGYKDPFEMIKAFDVGEYRDPWGCLWENNYDGVLGQVRDFPLNDLNALANYKPPKNLINKGFEDVPATLKKNKDKFVFAAQEGLFHRVCWLRDPQYVFMDILEESPDFFSILNMVHEFHLEQLKLFLKYEHDAMFIGDDWGSQKQLLIHPEIWRKIFKPLYKEYFDLAHKADKYVFFHSDGYIIDIIEDLIEIGVNAINCQVAVMGEERLSERFAGRICFYGEIDRQHILPKGSTQAVSNAVVKGKKSFHNSNGGYIFQAEIGPDVPEENIKELFKTWKELR